MRCGYLKKLSFWLYSTPFRNIHKFQLIDSVKTVFRNLRGNIPAALMHDESRFINFRFMLKMEMKES